MRFLWLAVLLMAFAGSVAADVRGVNVRVKDTGGTTVALYAESHALVIGISDYTNGWPKLRGVKEDVPAVKTALEKQGFQVTVVTDPDRDGLDDAFRDFINRHGQRPDNRILFYFAGHGHSMMLGYGGMMGYLVGRNAPNPNIDRSGFRRNALSMQVIETYARNIESKHALFVFDACFAGSIFDATRAIPEVIHAKTGKPVRQFINSCDAEQQVPDRSVFRRQFVAALGGEGDINGDGYVTGAELGQFLETTVTNYTRRSQTPKYGKLRDPLLDKGDFVFVTEERKRQEAEARRLAEKEERKRQEAEARRLAEKEERKRQETMARRKRKNRHAIALIIGNKNYTGRTPNVEFAHNDAESMKRFVVEVLGYREGNIIDLRDATQAQMTAVFGNKDNPKGKLFNWVRPGKANVTVFYSGHGVPGLKDRRGYLLPVDADPDLVELNGYPVDILYDNLSKIDAKSMTVYLDACFSGDSPKGMIVRATSGISLTIRLPKIKPGMIVLTAAQGDQFASWDEEAKHGLFTKNLLDALMGEADREDYGNGDGRVTAGEVQSFLDDEMSYQARRRYNREQKATVLGDTSVVLSIVR